MQGYVLLAFGISAAAASSSSPLVSSPLGSIQGKSCSSNANQFLGIPYGQPPVGPLRFAPPKAVTSYNGTFQAVTAASDCIQFGTFAVDMNAPQTEDCLTLDVWAPANAVNTSNLPVKVWLYGGANQAGGISDPTYDGCDIATDAVVVSINYRVGPLGFLSVPTADIPANNGIRDQLLGLQWVQDNIVSFGGDPSQVLLFGQSAGSFDTTLIATLPQAPKLIRAAIGESCGGVAYGSVASASSGQNQFVESLNCSITDTECIRSLSVEAMNATLVKSSTLVLPDAFVFPYNYTFQPLVDCDLLTTQPADVPSRVPTIIGSTMKEGTLFTAPLLQQNITSTDYEAFLEQNFGSAAPAVAAHYPVSNSSSSSSPISPYLENMITIITLSSFNCPTYRALRVNVANNVPVWTYRWNHTNTCPWYNDIPDEPEFLDFLGPTHTSEIPFVFNHTTSYPPASGNCTFPPSDQVISNQIVNAWTSMALNGNPGTGIDWPQFTVNGSQGINVQQTGIVTGVVDYSECAFWDEINAQVVQSVLGNSNGSCSAANSTNGTGSAGNGTAPSNAGFANSPSAWNSVVFAAVVGSLSALLL